MSIDDISQDEINRLNRARAVAKRTIMREMVEYLDGKIKDIEKGNPGRTRGSVSMKGSYASAILKEAADYIWNEREKIQVPD